MSHEKSNVEPVASQLEFLSQALDSGIADVDAIQEGHHEDHEQNRKDSEVDLAHEAILQGLVAVALDIDDRAGIGRCMCRREDSGHGDMVTTITVLPILGQGGDGRRQWRRAI